jgi:stalled ribosome rescue protein Dom34
MSVYHAAIWIDHREAHVFAILPDSFDRKTIRSHGEHHQHHKAGSAGSGHAKTDETYLHAVAMAVADAHEIYVCGPGSAKTEFVHHIEHHDKPVARKVVKVETVDHPTDGQVVAKARSFFKAFDRTTPQM